MDNFAFVIHPVNPKADTERKYPLLGKMLPESAINFFSRYFPPVYISHITGITSQTTGKEIEGWFIACPFTPKQMMALPPQEVYNKVIATGKLAQKLGAKILGLGGFTSVVGDGGITISKHLDIPVTTGNSYTVGTSVDALLKGGLTKGINPATATAAVMGATGSIGRVCAQLLAPQVETLILIGRNLESLQTLKDSIEAEGYTNVQISLKIEDLRQADLILTTTSTIDSIIQPSHLKENCVVCDVARPSDVSDEVLTKRKDVLVVEGGMIKVPGPVDFNFNFGFPPGMAFACMSETMALALEGRYESYTLGKTITAPQVQTIMDIATKHGFEVSGYDGVQHLG
ncbi:MAG: shikimate dehydrogenase [Chloroflexota bacterium]